MSQYSTEPADTSAFGTEPASAGEESTGSTTGQVKDQAREKAQVAQDKAKGALGQVRGRISGQVDQRSTQAGERLSQQASDARSVAQELRNQGKEGPAGLVEQVAGQADRLGDYLKGASGDRILRDIEDFARRQPMLVAAGGMVLGFAASRFMKASSSRRYQSGSQGHGDGGYRRTYAADTYGTGTSYGTDVGYAAEARYEADVPYAPATTPAAGTPVAGSYDPTTPAEGEPMGDAYDERRS